MTITVTEYNRLTEVDFSEIPDEKQRRKLRKYFRWNQDKRVWYSYDYGASEIRDIFDEDEIEILKDKQHVTVYLRNKRATLTFFEIPSESERTAMKEAGFKWDPETKRWFSNSENAEEVVRSIFADAVVKVVTEKDRANLMLDKVADKLQTFYDSFAALSCAINEFQNVDKDYANELYNVLVKDVDFKKVAEVLRYVRDDLNRK